VDVRALAFSPHDSRRVLAGSHIGLHASEDGGKTFDYINSPADRKQIWSVSWHPDDAETILVGVAGFDDEHPLYRTTNGGKTWDVLPLTCPTKCPGGATHVTSIVFDPRDHRRIWVGVEIGGIYRSDDAGETWIAMPPPGEIMTNVDIHNLAVTPSGKLFATTPDGVWTSTDDGETFSLYKFMPPFPDPDVNWMTEATKTFNITQYSRALALKPDAPNTIFVGTGDLTPGKVGAIQRSVDGGESWAPAALSQVPNSHIYAIASHKAYPNQLIAASMYGYLYTSEDAGATWRKNRREFGEIRALAWAPTK
jgi:photosystem II stability/assembly factor-like uncharacterized protein